LSLLGLACKFSLETLRWLTANERQVQAHLIHGLELEDRMTGPNISSLAMVMWSLTSEKTVGSMK
jgi:hypothetical protein